MHLVWFDRKWRGVHILPDAPTREVEANSHIPHNQFGALTHMMREVPLRGIYKLLQK